MENKDYIYLTIITVSIIFGVTSTVYDSGEEIVCRTGDGWTVINEYESYSDSECRYTTQPWLYANCSSFRATATKSRYGCNEVFIVKEIVEIPIIEEINYQHTGKQYLCSVDGCVQIK